MLEKSNLTQNSLKIIKQRVSHTSPLPKRKSTKCKGTHKNQQEWDISDLTGSLIITLHWEKKAPLNKEHYQGTIL